MQVPVDHEMTAQREVHDFLSMLTEYGLSVENLVKNNPRSWQDRERAKKIAHSLASEPSLMVYIKEHRCLPEAYKQMVAAGEQVWLERNFQYITGLALILSGDFPTLKGILHTWTGGDR